MDALQTISPGQKVRQLSAELHNKQVDMVRDWERGKAIADPDPNIVNEDIWILYPTDGTSGTADIRCFGVAGVGPLAVTPAMTEAGFEEWLAFNLWPPIPGAPFAILQEPLGYDARIERTARANLHGITRCKLWRSVKTHQYANIETSNSGYLVSQPGAGPATILWSGPTEYYVAIAATTGDLLTDDLKWLQLVGNYDPSPAWNANAVYDIGRTVLVGGVIYICTQRHKGHTPPNTLYWASLGAGLTPRDDWDSITEYAIGDITTGIVWAVVHLTGQVSDTTPIPSYSGTGALTLGTMTCAGSGTNRFAPGGGLRMGAMTIAGTGSYTAPTFTGSGALALSAFTTFGYGFVYTPPPSGVLRMKAMTIAGTGTVTGPATGAGALVMGAMTMSGIGSTAVPSFLGSGALTLGALTIAGTGAQTATSFASPVGFRARVENPLYVGGFWCYDWTELVFDDVTGDLEDGTHSGTALDGDWMRELNNNVVQTPTNVYAWLRGVWNNQPLYDFERCCTDGVFATEPGGADLLLGVMFMTASGTTTPPPVTGSGALVLGVMTIAGTGETDPRHEISAALVMGAMTMSGAGSVLTVTGSGAMSFGSMTMAGSGTASVSYYWQDTFTDTNGTLGASHTGEITPGGYSNFDSSRYQVLSNRFYVHTLNGGNAYVVFSNGHAEFTLNVDFLIASTATDNSNRQATIFFRFVDGNNYHYLNLTMASGNDATVGWFLVKNVAGTPTTLNSGSWSLPSSTVHAVVLTVGSSSISGTVGGGGNTFSGSSSDSNTEDTIILGMTSTQTGTNGHYWDNLLIGP